MPSWTEVEIPYDEVDYSAGKTARDLTQEDRDQWYATLDADASRRALSARLGLELNEQQYLELGL